MTGEFLYFAIYVAQQLGVMLGVGAQTVLLCTHLIAVHYGEKESPHASYARAARFALGTGLVLIVASGLAAAAVHMLNAQMEVVLAPAFLFKWLLIVLLIGVFVAQNKLTAWSNTYFAFAGGTWYALFLVHSLGPVVTWSTLWVLYAVWSVFFAAVWACFVAVMKWNIKKPALLPAPARKALVVAPPPAPKPVVQAAPPPPPVPKPVIPPPVFIPKAPEPARSELAEPVITVNIKPVVHTPPWWKRLLAWISAPKQKAVVATVLPLPLPPPPAPKPAVQAVAPPPPPPPPPPAPAPKLTITPPPPPAQAQLPVVKPLSLPVPPVTVVTPAQPPAPSLLKDVIDHLLVPALRIMPQKAEDIGKQNRPPVVKLEKA